MRWPNIRNLLSGVLSDFNAFLGVIFGNFIVMIAVLGWMADIYYTSPIIAYIYGTCIARIVEMVIQPPLNSFIHLLSPM